MCRIRWRWRDGQSRFAATAGAARTCRGQPLDVHVSLRSPGTQRVLRRRPIALNPKQAEGISVAVYAPHADSGKAQEFANIVAHQEIIFSDLFGALPDPDIAVVELPDGTLREFSAPGVVMLGHRVWIPSTAIAR